MGLNHSLLGTSARAVQTRITEGSLSAWRAGVDVEPAAATRLAGLSAIAAALTPPLLDPRLGADMMRLGHATLDLRLLAPVGAGDLLETVATFEAVGATDAGERLDLRLVSTRGGDVVVDATAGILLRGPRRKTPLQAASTTTVGQAASAVVVDRARIAALGAALGEHNPLFDDEDAARQAGLPACIAPNLGLFAIAWSALGAPPTLSVQFHRPALVDDAVDVVRDSARFTVVNQAGVVLIDGAVGSLS